MHVSHERTHIPRHGKCLPFTWLDNEQDDCSKCTERGDFSLHRSCACGKVMHADVANSLPTHSDLCTAHTEQATAARCGTAVSQPAGGDVIYSVLRCVVHNSTSSSGISPSPDTHSRVPRSDGYTGGSRLMFIRFVSDGNDCLPI